MVGRWSIFGVKFIASMLMLLLHYQFNIKSSFKQKKEMYNKAEIINLDNMHNIKNTMFSLIPINFGNHIEVIDFGQ